MTPWVRWTQRSLILLVVVVGLIALPRRAWLQKEAPGNKIADHLAPGVKPSLKEEAQQGHSQATVLGHGSANAAEGTEEGACPICPVSDAGEIQILLALRERRLVLNAREHQLAGREAAVEKLARDLDRRVAGIDAHLTVLEDKLNIGGPARARHEARLTALTDSLATMTAKKAAPMLAEADPEVAAEVMRRLGPQRTAALLTAMPAAKAGKLISLGVHVPAVANKAPAAKTPPQSTPASEPKAPGGP